MSQQHKKCEEVASTPGIGASLVHRYAIAVRRYFDRRLRHIQDTEDLAQEVYLRLLRIDADTKIQKPLHFVYGLARHVLLDHRADTAKRQGLLREGSDPLSATECPSDVLGDRLEDLAIVEQQLSEIMSTLPPLHSSVLLLHDRDGRSYEEVAATLNISVHTVKKYLTQGRARVRMSFWDY